MNPPTYTFYYCLSHDDGCCAPTGSHVNPCGVNSPDNVCDIIPKGTIAFDGQEVTVVEPVFKNYELYDGGFLFSSFATNLKDSNGNMIHEHPIIDWIREQAAPNRRQAAH